MKVFITASSGVGKTAVIDELLIRGCKAYDADDRSLDLTRLEVKATGEPVDWPSGYVDWSYYSWSADEDRLKQLLSKNDPVFLAGLLGNQEALYYHFDKLIALTIEPSEHKRRLYARPQREVDDDEANIQRRLDKYSVHMEKFVASGFTTIDNTGPVERTVDSILKSC